MKIDLQVYLLVSKIIDTILPEDNKTNTKEDFLNKVAAIHAAEKLLENSPSSFYLEVTQQEIDKAKQDGTEVALKLANKANEVINFTRN